MGKERAIGTCIWSALTLLRLSILQDHLVDDFSAGDALPSKEGIFFTAKFFIDHLATTLTAFHGSLPIPKDIALTESTYNRFFKTDFNFKKDGRPDRTKTLSRPWGV
jgi:hypothetical protein